MEKEKAKAGRVAPVGRPRKEAPKVEVPRGAVEMFCSSASDDPVWRAVRSSGLVKEELPDGVLRLACPWGPHAEDIPQKTEFYWHGYQGRERGFHCFADQCDGGGHNVGDLIRWLEASGHLGRGWRGRLSSKTAGLYSPLSTTDQGGEEEALPEGFLDGELFGAPGWIVFEHRERSGVSIVPLVRAPFTSLGWVIGEDVARRAVLRGIDLFGEEKEWIVPIVLDARKLWAELVSVGGLSVGAHDERAARKLLELVCALSERAGCQVATRCAGWQFKRWEQELPFNREVDGTPMCVLNDWAVIGCDVKRAPVLIADELIPMREAGTVKSWREEVAPLVKGQSKALVALSVPFYAILARLMGWTGGALFLVGPSSTGKTSLLKVAASVDGVPIEGARSTANFVGSRLMAIHDVASTCDDLKQLGKALVEIMPASIDWMKGEFQNQSVGRLLFAFASEFVKIATLILIGWQDAKAAWRHGDKKGAAAIAIRGSLGILSLSLFSALLMGQGPGDDEELHKWALRTGLATIGNSEPFILKQLVNGAILPHVFGQQVSTPQVPLIATGQRTAAALRSILTRFERGGALEDPDTYMDAVEFMGPAFLLPTSVIGRTIRPLLTDEENKHLDSVTDPIELLEAIIYGRKPRRGYNVFRLIGD